MNQTGSRLEKCRVFVPVVPVPVFNQTQHAEAGVSVILKRQMQWRGPNQMESTALFTDPNDTTYGKNFDEAKD